MKKTLATLLALLPVIYLATLGVLAWLDAADEPLLMMMLVYFVAALALHIAYTAHTTHADGRFLAVSSLWISGVNLVFFLAEIILWLVRLEENRIAEANGAMEGGLGLVLMILIYLPHWFSYLMSRITGTISCYRALNGVCSETPRLLHSLLQLLPGGDLLSTIWMIRRIKKSA